MCFLKYNNKFFYYLLYCFPSLSVHSKITAMKATTAIYTNIIAGFLSQSNPAIIPAGILTIPVTEWKNPIEVPFIFPNKSDASAL